MQENRKNLIFMCVSQFAAGFSFTFVNVFLPFFILNVSPYPAQYTLFWVGMIIGSASLAAGIISPFWGSLCHRMNPKRIYVGSLLANSFSYLLMALTTDLHLLLILRILQGLLGGVSTIGFIMVSCTSRKERLSRDIGLFQSFMTLGYMIGPPLGSFGAVAFGYRGAFLSAAIVLCLTSVFCHLFVINVAPLQRTEETSGSTPLNRQVIMGWGICFIAQCQLIFLPSILPNVFDSLGIERTLAIKLAGTVVMLYTGSAMVGTYVWCRLSKRLGQYRTIALLLFFSMLFQMLLIASRGVINFTLIRMLQTGLAAAIFPLVISAFMKQSTGGVIGFLNSSRFIGNGIAPFLATSVLAVSNLTTVYILIGGATFLGFVAFTLNSGRERLISSGVP